MTSYNFTQQVGYPSLLQTQIQASSISTALDHIETDGSGSGMLVMVWFVSALSSADQTTLNSIMAAYADPSGNAASMIANITASIATDANLILLLRTRVAQVLPTLNIAQLQAVCTLLGISF